MQTFTMFKSLGVTRRMIRLISPVKSNGRKMYSKTETNKTYDKLKRSNMNEKEDQYGKEISTSEKE